MPSRSRARRIPRAAAAAWEQFYNPAAADDRAIEQELSAVPAHHHQVIKLAIPIGELSRYQVVTTPVVVNQSPTLVLIDRQKQATTLVGFASGFEIAQRVADAAAVK